MKKGLDYKKILVIILLIILVTFVILKIFEKDFDECIADSECVPAGCCHPGSCVSINQKPNCSEIFCSQVCSGPLNCGAGHCGCVKGKCGVISNED